MRNCAHVAMNWARRLKRVFGVEIERCGRCAGRLRIIASIEQPSAKGGCTRKPVVGGAIFWQLG